MINQWGLYAGLGSSETTVARPTEQVTVRHLAVIVTFVMVMAIVLATVLVLYSAG